MRSILRAAAVAGLVCCGPMMPSVAADALTYGSGPNAFSLATGSPGELGLLKLLGETFSAKQQASLKWVKAGTGQSLKLLREQQVDMVMVHAPGGEEKAIAEGWATQRTLIGSNEFYIVGPANDPAGIAAAGNGAEAYRRIARSGARFVSRGDNSGTHQKEMQIWAAAGVKPEGTWYIVTREFMTASLKRADAEGAYFMTDSSTWVAERSNAPGLRILMRGDKALVNTYHALAAAEGATPGRETALRFIRFVASEEGQRIIRDYGKERYGEALYNDAAYARRFVD
ncbi:MAG: substrate-binding domain-containing protein [Rhodocyclaceae bacterium]|jgi:tungstate transport system substrate-binding protein|nr:substrate-binding domain-containing protein [Rhodocyclaceae bacterium]